jgi:hypothetical protein
MRVRSDREADAVYVNSTDRPIKESEEVADGIVVDYDDAGPHRRHRNPGRIETDRGPGGAQEFQLRSAGYRLKRGLGS